MCVDLCVGMFAAMCAGMCVDIRAHMYVDMYVDMWAISMIGMRAGMCIDMLCDGLLAPDGRTCRERRDTRTLAPASPEALAVHSQDS